MKVRFTTPTTIAQCEADEKMVGKRWLEKVWEERTIPNSSNSAIVSLLVLQAGAVQPLGLFPVKSCITLILFSNTSLCCCSLNPLTNSCVYPCSPISCPLSTIFLICLGKDSTECAGVNQVALMLYLSQSFSRRSMPTVAPKTPRETSVGLAGLPSRVFSLVEWNVSEHKDWN